MHVYTIHPEPTSRTGSGCRFWMYSINMHKVTTDVWSYDLCNFHQIQQLGVYEIHAWHMAWIALALLWIDVDRGAPDRPGRGAPISAFWGRSNVPKMPRSGRHDQVDLELRDPRRSTAKPTQFTPCVTRESRKPQVVVSDENYISHNFIHRL